MIEKSSLILPTKEEYRTGGIPDNKAPIPTNSPILAIYSLYLVSK